MSDMPILQLQDVSKRFGGLQALAHATFDLPRGQILGLIGPNGAGKTTLFNCINGVYPPEEGRVLFLGEDITGFKPYKIARRGLARTHQIVQPLEELTVLENVMLPMEFVGKVSPMRRRQIRGKRTRASRRNGPGQQSARPSGRETASSRHALRLYPTTWPSAPP